MHHRRGIPAWSTLDFAAALVSAFVALLFLALVQQKRYTVPPALRTPGVLAVVATWNGHRDEDVDLYLRAPNQTVVFFANRESGDGWHLEHDWLGWQSDIGNRHPRFDTERVVMNGIAPGRVAVSVQLYRQGTPGPTPVTVSVYRLIGADRELVSVHVVLAAEGSEVPCVQFSVSANGDVSGFTRLPIYLARGSWTGNR